ncbi:MAG: alpha-ketoglutarate-dependent dioxygenase AlkB [Deltaproteobacteria bacterium]|nr:MAG: alpha-ketoglutarate-dependent dioxygenase AlkB [Deltaproteobacteria bacterium]
MGRDLSLPGTALELDPDFLDPEEADQALATLLDLPWRADSIVLFGKRHPLPRLHQWFGDPGLAYTWSGLRMEPVPWTPALAALRDRVSARCGVAFNTVLANLYRDGQDAMGWHADDEDELGPEPVIASLSLGATRDFQLKHRTLDLPTWTLPLTHGSLLVMSGTTQASAKHALPRRKRCQDPRINLTFRRIVHRS